MQQQAFTDMSHIDVSNIDTLHIDTPQQLKLHIERLIVIEPRFKPIYQQFGVPDLRRQPEGFAQMVRVIVGQQVSKAAASSIFARIEQAGLTTIDAIQAADDDTLRKHGLSKQKIRYIHSLAAHEIDYDKLRQLSDEAVIKQLTAVAGIGRWTAQMYLLFSLGRADVLAVDDLAIKVAVEALLGLNARPIPSQLIELTAAWSPHRSAASLLLWQYYDKLKTIKK